MNRRKALALLATAPIAMRSRSSMAGGMALVYLLGEPPRMRAGESWRLRFILLSHDMTSHALGGLGATISMFPKSEGEAAIFEIEKMGSSVDTSPVYEADITIPSPGAYKWSIAVGPFPPTFFPTLHVEGVEEDEATPIAVDETVVTIDAQEFSPSEVMIYPGRSVRWINTDASSAHQVVWNRMEPDDSPLFPMGGEFTMIFNDIGRYEYSCGPHPHMTGVVIVSDA